MKTPLKILIVEDDPHIQLGLQELLKTEGFETAVCARGDQALDAVSKHRPDLIVLDIMLPGMSGYDVCRALRTGGNRTPILVLTAKGQELDKVTGLDLGADDYVTKPFGIRELVARIHALLRRGRGPQGASSASACPFQIGEVSVDPRAFILRRGDHHEELTAKEMKLLQYLFDNAGEVLSRDRLLTEVWGYNHVGSTRTLDQVIVQIRKKIGDTASDPRHLTTVHGVGYKLRL